MAGRRGAAGYGDAHPLHPHPLLPMQSSNVGKVFEKRVTALQDPGEEAAPGGTHTAQRVS